jgi:transposase
MVTAADEDTAIAVDVLPGQAHDAPHLTRMLDRTLARVPVVDEVVGDKGFDGDRLREECLDRDVNPNIPLKANRPPDRWAWDPEGYRERNRVERLLGKAKQFRRFLLAFPFRGPHLSESGLAGWPLFLLPGRRRDNIHKSISPTRSDTRAQVFCESVSEGLCASEALVSVRDYHGRRHWIRVERDFLSPINGQ